MFSKNIFLPLLAVVICVSAAFSLEIPISGSLQRDKETANGIVFVDMDRVFEAHPMSQRYRTELKNFANTRKTAIDEMVKQYENLKKQLPEVSAKIAAAHEADNQAALEELGKQFDGIQKAVEEQRLKIVDLSKRTKSELAALEEKNSMEVLKDIDIVLKDVARKYDAQIMLDKQSVLCGSETCEDVTPEVIKRLEGR